MLIKEKLILFTLIMTSFRLFGIYVHVNVMSHIHVSHTGTCIMNFVRDILSSCNAIPATIILPISAAIIIFGDIFFHKLCLF
jgi:hypothetical protein